MRDKLREISVTNNVLTEVGKERIRQEEKWGEQNHDPFTYLAILGEEVGESNQAALEAKFSNKTEATWDYKQLLNYREELIQVAAVAVAMVECLDRNRWANFGCGLKELEFLRNEINESTN